MKPSTADLIVQLIDADPSDYAFFHTPDGEAFVTLLQQDERAETVRVASIRFRRHLEQRFYLTYGRVPNAQAVQDALGVLAGRALFAGPEHSVACRIGA